MKSTPTRTPFRAMTYNVENAFDEIDDPLTDDPLTAKPMESCAAVAEVIRDSRAVVVALQEVENQRMLERLVSFHGLRKLYPHRVLIEGNDPRGVDVALLSQFPLTDVKSHKERIVGWRYSVPQKFRRDLLQADVRLPNQKRLRVYVTHYPASYGAHRMRLREAEATRDIVAEQSRDYPVDYNVVMGDFNALERSDPMERLTDRRAGGLYNTSSGLPMSYGHREGSRKEWQTRIDHILCGPNLKSRLIGQGVFHHPKESLASDHRPVWSDFDLVV